MTNAAQIQGAVQSIGSLDVLINNAGVDFRDDLSGRAGLERHLAVNLYVLGWAAAEAATLIGGSPASINSALQRARETLAKHDSADRLRITSAPDRPQQELLNRYLQAWEGLDVGDLAALLKEDATYTMPPLPQWYAGRQRIRMFFERAWKLYDGFRLIPTAANRQPAFAAYSRSTPDAPWTAHSIHLLTLADNAIAALTLFVKPEGPRLFDAFELPLVLPQAGSRRTRLKVSV